MKNAEFMAQALTRIPDVEATGVYSQVHTYSEDGWYLMVENWEIDPRMANIEFHLVYNPNMPGKRRCKRIGLWGHKKLGSTGWVLGKPYRLW